MLERYIEKRGKKLRYGYTTGSCAAAATKAACTLLADPSRLETHFIGEEDVVQLMTPKGWLLDIPYTVEKIDRQSVTCSVIKDSGDDPDMTKGIKIYAEVTIGTGRAYKLQNGLGVGLVTKAGLSVPVGSPAINPVPQKMIRSAIEEILETVEGVSVTISAPEGLEIAKRTFNPRLGIVDGISIIGTTGIVEPMSEDAIIDTIKVELSVLAKTGTDTILLTPGNYGRDFAEGLFLRTNHLLKTSNYIGVILDEAEKLEIKRILWVGHIGKMVKVAGGIFHTHSSMADGRMEILTAYLGLAGAPTALLKSVMQANTTDDAIHKIKEMDYMHIFNQLAAKVSERSMQRVFGNIQVGTILFSNAHGLLGMDETAQTLMEDFKDE